MVRCLSVLIIYDWQGHLSRENSQNGEDHLGGVFLIGKLDFNMIMLTHRRCIFKNAQITRHAKVDH